MALKIFSQEQWCDLVKSAIAEEVADVLGSSTNPENNDVSMGDTPADAVCISDESIADLKARADWLWQEGDEEKANMLMDCVRSIEAARPNRSELTKALFFEGKA